MKKANEFGSPAEKIALGKILRNIKRFKATFNNVTTSFGKEQGFGRQESAISLDLRDRLMSELLVISQATFSPVFQLQQAIQTELMAAQQKSDLLTVIFLIILAFFVIAISLWINRSIARPISELEKGIRIVGSGNLDHKVGTTATDEIGQLSRSFDMMTGDLKKTTASIVELSKEIEHRKQAEEGLRESEGKYRTLFEQSNDAIIIHELSGQILEVNQRTSEMLGYNHEQFHRMTIPMLHPKTEYGASEKAIQVTRSEDYTLFESQFEREDGTLIDVEISSSIIDKANGMVQGIIRDITERKQTEKQIKTSLREKETLLKEIHHRVKNNLAVISSLLYMQSSSVDDEKAREALKASMTRVKTMAMIHTQLYQHQDLSRVDFSIFTRDLSDNIRQIYVNAESPVEITVDCDDIHLDIDTSIPCGLILNELISNALKHAFPEGRGGEIHITMQLDDTVAVLTVQDNGIGFPESIDDITKAKSLGLELVNILVKQVKGTIDRQVDGGTTWTITVPVKNERK